MMQQKVIAVDVDLTVVDTLTPWMNWFYARTGEHIKNEDGAYDLVPEMNEIIQRKGLSFDPFDFWRIGDLYDELVPIPFSMLALASLSQAGHAILFVSSCVPEHTASKQAFLNKWFPYHNGFIATKDKHFVDYDVLVDDRIEHILHGQAYRPDAKHFLYTGIRQDGHPERDKPVLKNMNKLEYWSDLYNYLSH
jgi:5'(3')-deoxyribonucleotidase